MKEKKPEGPSCNPGKNVFESLFSVDLGLAHSKHGACPESIVDYTIKAL